MNGKRKATDEYDEPQTVRQRFQFVEPSPTRSQLSDMESSDNGSDEATVTISEHACTNSDTPTYFDPPVFIYLKKCDGEVATLEISKKLFSSIYNKEGNKWLGHCRFVGGVDSTFHNKPFRTPAEAAREIYNFQSIGGKNWRCKYFIED